MWQRHPKLSQRKMLSSVSHILYIRIIWCAQRRNMWAFSIAVLRERGELISFDSRCERFHMIDFILLELCSLYIHLLLSPISENSPSQNWSRIPSSDRFSSDFRPICGRCILRTDCRCHLMHVSSDLHARWDRFADILISKAILLFFRNESHESRNWHVLAPTIFLECRKFWSLRPTQCCITYLHGTFSVRSDYLPSRRIPKT